jgi:hypothetical protein
MTDADTVRVTYAELARARGVSMAAARRLAQRHRWPKQVGNDGLSHVLVPATYLARSEPDRSDVATALAGDVTGYIATDVGGDVADDRSDLQILSFDEVIAAFTDVAHDMATRVATDVAGNVAIMLQEQLIAERDRADRAENRAQAAEGLIREKAEQLITERLLRAEDKERADRAEQQAKDAEGRAEQAEVRLRDLQDQLTAEMVEHRRVVSMLTEQLAARRSWWPWRR